MFEHAGMTVDDGEDTSILMGMCECARMSVCTSESCEHVSGPALV